MINSLGRYEIGKALMLSNMGSRPMDNECPAPNLNERYKNTLKLANNLQTCHEMLQGQIISERRKSPTGGFWRKTPAGALLRRKLSSVEIVCIALLVSVSLAISK